MGDLPSSMDLELLNTIKYGVVGGCFGCGISFVLGCSLLEISINEGFAVAFGTCMLLLGLIVGWRAAFPDVPPPTVVRFLTSISAAMIVSAGAFCILLEKDWVSNKNQMIVVAVAGLGGGALLGCLFAMDNAEDSYWAFIAEEHGAVMLGGVLGVITGVAMHLLKDTDEIKISQVFGEEDALLL